MKPGVFLFDDNLEHTEIVHKTGFVAFLILMMAASSILLKIKRLFLEKGRAHGIGVYFTLALGINRGLNFDDVTEFEVW